MQAVVGVVHQRKQLGYAALEAQLHTQRRGLGP